MTTSNSSAAYIANGVDVTVTALPGSEGLPTMVLLLETTGGVYLQAQGASVDPSAQLVAEAAELVRTGESGTLGATFEFGWLGSPDTAVAGAMGFAAIAGAHSPLGTVHYPGPIVFGGHPKPVAATT